jgi:hypothetical protein
MAIKSGSCVEMGWKEDVLRSATGYLSRSLSRCLFRRTQVPTATPWRSEEWKMGWSVVKRRSSLRWFVVRRRPAIGTLVPISHSWSRSPSCGAASSRSRFLQRFVEVCNACLSLPVQKKQRRCCRPRSRWSPLMHQSCAPVMQASGTPTVVCASVAYSRTWAPPSRMIESFRRAKPAMPEPSRQGIGLLHFLPQAASQLYAGNLHKKLSWENDIPCADTYRTS